MILKNVLTLVSFILMLITAIPILHSQANCSNLLTNHSFENGFTDWATRTANGAVASFNTVNTTATDGSFSAEVISTVLGVNFWDAQIKRNNIPVVAGTQYEVSFDAKTSAGAVVMKYGVNTTVSNTFVAGADANLTTSWQRFSKVFTPATADDVSVYYNFGNILGTYNIDNVIVSEYCPAIQLDTGVFCQTESSPGINGSEGALWEDAVEHNIQQIYEGSVTNGSDLSAYYKVIWNANNLFFVVNVNDDSKVNDSPVALADFDDGVEIYLDMNNDKANSYDANDHHFLFRWNDPDIHHISAGQINPAGAEAAFASPATGYILEIKLPYSLLGNPASIIGIDVHINDDDNGGDTREAKMAWFEPSTAVNNNPSLFGEGELQLTFCGATPATYPIYDPVICADLPPEVYHCSGIIVNHENSFWTHNDKQGDLAPTNDSILYELDATGAILREVYLTGIDNADWEDLAQDDDGNFYIGEIGSGNPNTEFEIHKIKNPLYFCDTDYVSETIYFRYPVGDNHGDTESMFYWDGYLYLIPKINGVNNAKASEAHIYKIPAIANTLATKYTAEYITGLELDPGNPVDPDNLYKSLSADISPDGQTVVMIGGKRMWFVTDFTPGVFLDGQLTIVDFPSQWQREAIAFVDNTSLYIIDEDNNDNPNKGKLAKVDLCEIIPDHPACTCEARIVTDNATSSNDSAEEYEDGTVNRGSSDMELTYDNITTGNQTIGLRFSNLGIPQGSSIQNAYIQFTVDETDVSQASSLTIWGEATANSTAFTNTINDVSNRVKTNSSQSWSFVDWIVNQVATRDQQTANIASIVQEIVNQGGWAPNNNIAFIIEGQGSQTAERHVGCDNSAPRLWVEYCENAVACASSLTLNNQNIAAGIYQVSDYIESNGVVQSPTLVTFKANNITLNPDFMVMPGATFVAEIDPCGI